MVLRLCTSNQLRHTSPLSAILPFRRRGNCKVDISCEIVNESQEGYEKKILLASPQCLLSSFVSEECKNVSPNSPPDWIPSSVSIPVTRTQSTRVCSMVTYVREPHAAIRIAVKVEEPFSSSSLLSHSPLSHSASTRNRSSTFSRVLQV